MSNSKQRTNSGSQTSTTEANLEEEVRQQFDRYIERRNEIREKLSKRRARVLGLVN